jgi:uracil-DNA glycosylase
MELFDEKTTKTSEQKQAILDNVRLPEDWKTALAEELTSHNMDDLRAFLK